MAHEDAAGFCATQREAGEADLHEQGFGADRTGGEDLDVFARDEAEFAQAARDGVVGSEVFDALDGGGDAAREVGQPQGPAHLLANRNCSQE